jgi:hypothetical protein
MRKEDETGGSGVYGFCTGLSTNMTRRFREYILDVFKILKGFEGM